MKEKTAPNVQNADRFAATSVRLRTEEPGTSGDRDRDSIHPKADSSAADAASSPSAGPEPQPNSVPRLTPYTSRSRPPVTVTAPAMSKRSLRRRPRASPARKIAAIAMSAAPTGTLMKKIQRQPGPAVSRPLAITPTDADIPVTAPNAPSARLRSAPSANVTARIERAAGATSAAPKPCRARAPISSPADPATPASSEADENRVSPVSSMRRRPTRSAILPPSSRNPPSMRPYAMTIHCRAPGPMPRSCWIEGRATFTIATSSTTMNCAAHDRTRTIPLLVCALVATMTHFRYRVSGTAARLRVADQLVSEEGEASTDGLRAEQAQRLLVTGRAEQALARPEHDRDDDQPQLIGQVVLDQRAHQLIAGVDQDFPGQLLLQLGDLGHRVTPQQGRVAPAGL